MIFANSISSKPPILIKIVNWISENESSEAISLKRVLRVSEVDNSNVKNPIAVTSKSPKIQLGNLNEIKTSPRKR